MAIKKRTFDTWDLSAIEKDFYGIDRDIYLSRKPLEFRLSSGSINYSAIKDDKDFFEKATKYLTRTAFGLFNYITNERYPAVHMNIQAEGSWCNMVENKIQIGLKLLNHKDIPYQTRVDMIAGIIYHEYYHKRYTNHDIAHKFKIKGLDTEYFKHPEVEDWLKKILHCDVIRSIFNLVEDRRIEALGADEFPGYVFFFEETRKYGYYLHAEKKFTPKDGYSMYIIDYLMAAILIPELKKQFWTDFDTALVLLKKFYGTNQMPEKEFKDAEASYNKTKDVMLKMEEYIDINHSKVFSFNFDDAIEATQELFALIPKEMADEMNAEMKKKNKVGFNKITEEGMAQCFNKVPIEDLPQDVQDMINETIQDEIEAIEREAEEARKNKQTERKVVQEKIKSKSQNHGFSDFELIDEPIVPIDHGLYTEAKKISKNITKHLGFLDSRYERNVETYELSEGEIDDTELYSIAFDNKHIFEDVEAIPSYALDFGILLDESGSMSSRIYEAKLATLSMILGLKDNKHINLFVYGHTANEGRSDASIQILKYFNTLKRETDYRKIFSAKARSSNADGYAIERVAEFMKESKAREKILIVVSDGQPSAYGYGGAEGERHVKEVVDRLEAEGIMVIQVCMAYIENSPRMFNHYVQFEKNGQFFEALKRILMTKLNQFADSF